MKRMQKVLESAFQTEFAEVSLYSSIPNYVSKKQPMTLMHDIVSRIIALYIPAYKKKSVLKRKFLRQTSKLRDNNNISN